jgi:hypothetical protein
MLADNLLSGALEIPGARVVTEPGPEMQHLIERRGSQGCDIRKALQEAPVIINHGCNLGLLQHDLRHPDPVGRPLVLPGQIVPAVLAVPADQRKGESGHASASFSS